MSYYGTYTVSQSSTYTEARAEYVAQKILEDLYALWIRGFLTASRAESWKSDLLYLMKKEALDYFEFQMTPPNGKKEAFRYTIKASGTICIDNESGGTNFYEFPDDTKVVLFVSLDKESDNIEDAKEYIKDWGKGTSVGGNTTRIKSYSKNGYGVNIDRVG